MDDLYERIENLARGGNEHWCTYTIRFRDGYEFETPYDNWKDAVREAIKGGGKGRGEEDIQCILKDNFQVLHDREMVWENKDDSKGILKDVVDILFCGSDYNDDYDIEYITYVGDGHGAIIKRDGHEYRINISKEEE